MDYCEWNPKKHMAALHEWNPKTKNYEPLDDGSCRNEAELLLGQGGTWRVCRDCYEKDAAYFTRYKSVRPVKPKPTKWKRPKSPIRY